MVELGEQTGRLDDVMESLAAHYRREEALSRNLRSAVAYPLVMLGMMIAVMAVLLIKVMPIFRQVFAKMWRKENISPKLLPGRGFFQALTRGCSPQASGPAPWRKS